MNTSLLLGVDHDGAGQHEPDLDVGGEDLARVLGVAHLHYAHPLALEALLGERRGDVVDARHPESGVGGSCLTASTASSKSLPVVTV